MMCSSSNNNFVHNNKTSDYFDSNLISPSNSFLRSVHIENAIKRGRAGAVPLASKSYVKTWLYIRFRR